VSADPTVRSPFAFLDRPTDAPVLIDAVHARVWSQEELAGRVIGLAARLGSDRKELVFCLCDASPGSVVGYLAAVHAGHAVALLDAQAPAELTRRLIDHYHPAFVLAPEDGENPSVARADAAELPHPGPELAVMLSTSGTTGSPKFVRLARANIDANAHAIVQFLELGPDQRAALSLPLHYSYGLSVLNSHLAAGASVILSPHSLMRPDFWSDAERWKATSFAGVPYSYAILDRTGLLRTALPPSITRLTVSGGKLAPPEVIKVHDLIRARGGRLWVMYGQTEATARISYVPPESLPTKADTIGLPIPGGRLRVMGEDGELTEPGAVGELVYTGPNVMLGYAGGPEDLALDDSLHGELRTGDLGTRDEDGFFVLTGRIKRIAKVFGLRVNLDEIEAAAALHGPVAAVDGGETIVLWRVAGATLDSDALRSELARRFALNPRAFTVCETESLPMKSSGKVDYTALV
jgi:acyl-CoA synthetase (AMP-forming)/AMP-acid ligase II